jgi:predicted nucleotidyltransferase
MKPAIEIPKTDLEAFCTRHHIQRLALFGSVLRDDFGPDSDVDILVEFEPEAQVGYFTLVTIQHELENMIGREVDLLTPGALNPRFRHRVIAKAQVVYE